jgi:hypothetical protein
LREFAAQSSGETPADVLLGAMREFWGLAQKSTNARKRSIYLRAAAAIARDTAPYFHARRASTANTPDAHVVVEVIGGLPRGSTPQKPEGDDYSDVPPEEPRWVQREVAGHAPEK